MNEKRSKASKKHNIKFSALEMTDHFVDGDHSHEEFNYRPQVRTDDAVDSTLIDTPASPAGNSIGGDPHAHGLGGDLKSAVLGIVKGMVGPAILYLPHGFAQAGWAVAVPMLFASTALYLASSASLLECWEFETRNNKRIMQMPTQMEDGGEDNIEMKQLRRSNSTRISPDSGNSTGEEFDNEYLEGALVTRNGETSANVTRERGSPSAITTPSYPGLAKKAFGRRGKTVVEIGIAAMQSGVCLTYLIFVPRNMSIFWRELFEKEVSTTVFLILMVLVQIPLSWIREIRHLTVTNALANSLIMYGLITCLGFAFQEAVEPVPGEENDGGEDAQRGAIGELFYKFFHLKPFNSSGWFLFIGTSVLLFEGSITLLIPLQEAVATPQDRQYFPKMYPNVILCIIWFYLFFGIFCWMSFGDKVETVMTTSLPETNLAETVQLAYSVAVMLTFPLQNFPSLEIACATFERILVDCSASPAVRNSPSLFGLIQMLRRREVLSSLLVCALAVIAKLTMYHLDKVVSLMGGLLGCPLAFVGPPLIHNKLASMTPEGYNLSDRRRLQNKIVAALGLCAMVVATISTILEWNDPPDEDE